MPVNYREHFGRATDNTLSAVIQKPRKWVLVNVLLTMVWGAVIGGAIGAVAAISANWDPPWPYIGYMAVSLTVKVVFTTAWELVVVPILGKTTERLARREGVPVPQDGLASVPSGNLNAQLGSILTVIAACIGMALALGTKESQESWLAVNIPIWAIIMGVGGIVAAAEALTHKEVMRGIWHNEFSYQRRQRDNLPQPPAEM